MAPQEVAFIRPPKVAGTSISETLGLKVFERPEEIKKKLGWVDFSHMHVPSLKKAGWLPADYDPFAFSFVRNPYDRAVSLYFYMKNYKMIRPNGTRVYRLEANIKTFLDFCRLLEKREFYPVGVYNNKKRSIFNPQWEWLKDIELDFLGRYETLQEDFDRLCDKLEIEQKELPIIRATEHEPYDTYYCKESRRIIRDVYKDDFKNLAYEK